MVGKKKRVRAMKGKRVKARKGKAIKTSTETELERKIRLGTKRMGPGKKRDEKVRKIKAADRAAKADKSASKFYTDNPDMIEKHAKTGSVGLFGAKKDLTNKMLQRDYKSGGGKMKKVGKRVKAMGGKNVGMGKRVKAMGGKNVGMGKRVKAMKGKRVKARGGMTMKGMKKK